MLLLVSWEDLWVGDCTLWGHLLRLYLIPSQKQEQRINNFMEWKVSRYGPSPLEISWITRGQIPSGGGASKGTE